MRDPLFRCSDDQSSEGRKVPIIAILCNQSSSEHQQLDLALFFLSNCRNTVGQSTLHQYGYHTCRNLPERCVAGRAPNFLVGDSRRIDVMP
jgi:hypothetical protein